MIDTPPGNPAISRSAVLAVDLVVIPTSPTLVDLDRLLPTLDLLIEDLGEYAEALAELTAIRTPA